MNKTPIFSHSFEIEDLGIIEDFVYDVEVEDNHNFFANDILVHNSFFLDVVKLADKFNNNNDKTDDEICDMVDKFDKDIIQPTIRKRAVQHFEMLNGFEDALFFDREKIGAMLITGKKRYAISLLDNEGTRYHPRKITVTGIEIKRSSTPALMRIKLEEALHLIFEQDNESVVDFIGTFKSEYISGNYKLNEIAIPTGISDMEKYTETVKGVPIHVRSAKVANELIKRNNLDYEIINSGDKIKWVRLKMPNMIQSDVIAFNDPNMIYDLKLEKYIDYQEMFEKTFIKPLSTIIESIGWKMDIESSLMKEMF